MNDAVAVFKCLGDQTRFDILRLLYTSDNYVELLASKLGLTSGTVSFHLKKLEKAGLVKCSRTQFYMIYSLDRSVISKTLESFLCAEEFSGGDNSYEKKVIASFFDGEKLKNIPAQLKKREIIYKYIIEDFEWDREYTETEVNEKIMRRHDDFCTIRREFIGFGLMERNKGIYRRI